MKSRKILIFVFIATIFFMINRTYKVVFKEMLIDEIAIDGCNHMDKKDIEEKIDAKNLLKNDILHLNVNDLRKTIMSFPLIKEVIVQKKYSHSLQITVVERVPVFLVANNKQYYIYDKEGNLAEITNSDIRKYEFLSSLIYVEGENVVNEVEFLADAFLDQKFTKRISGLYRVGGRRWDMILDKKIKVMLPEKINKESIVSIINMIDIMKSKNNIKSQSVYTILDARIKDKVFVKNIGD